MVLACKSTGLLPWVNTGAAVRLYFRSNPVATGCAGRKSNRHPQFIQPAAYVCSSQGQLRHTS
jgi:hypothetical protein